MTKNVAAKGLSPSGEIKASSTVKVLDGATLVIDVAVELLEELVELEEIEEMLELEETEVEVEVDIGVVVVVLDFDVARTAAAPAITIITIITTMTATLLIALRLMATFLMVEWDTEASNKSGLFSICYGIQEQSVCFEFRMMIPATLGKKDTARRTSPFCFR